MPHISYREESRKNYGEQRSDLNPSLTRDQLDLGCQMRSADALEQIAKTMPDISIYLNNIRWNLDRMAQTPIKTKREITRLKNIIKKQKEEIAQLKGGE
jgi:hypothetical protein